MSWPSQRQQHLNKSTYLCAHKFAKALLHTLSHLSLTIIPILEMNKLRLEKTNYPPSTQLKFVFAQPSHRRTKITGWKNGNNSQLSDPRVSAGTVSHWWPLLNSDLLPKKCQKSALRLLLWIFRKMKNQAFLPCASDIKTVELKFPFLVWLCEGDGEEVSRRGYFHFKVDGVRILVKLTLTQR